MGHYYYYWDPTYILVVIGAIICMIASAKVKTTFNKYSQYRSYSGMNGAQVAQRVLEAAGIYDVTVRHVSGNLTDHYDPSTKTVNLSDPVYNSYSVAALGVAAHECGHAIQHAKIMLLYLFGCTCTCSKFRLNARMAAYISVFSLTEDPQHL